MFHRYKCIHLSHLLSDFVNDFLFNLIFYSLAVIEVQLILCILILYPIIQLNSLMVFFIYYQIFYRQFCCLKIKTSLLLSNLYTSCFFALPECIGQSPNPVHNSISEGNSLVVQWQRIPCQRRRLNSWSGKIPQAVEQLGLCSTTSEPVLQSRGAATTEPVCHNF